MRTLSIAFFLLSVTLAICIQADDITHAGHAAFQIPDGWVQLKNSKSVVLVPEDLPKGKTTYIAVLSPRKTDTTLSQWFKQEWQQLQASYTVVEGGEPEAQIAKAGYETVSAVAKVRDQQNKLSVIWLMGAHVNDRVERFLFLCEDDDHLERYQKGLAAFISSLTFDDLQSTETQKKEN